MGDDGVIFGVDWSVMMMMMMVVVVVGVVGVVFLGYKALIWK